MSPPESEQARVQVLARVQVQASASMHRKVPVSSARHLRPRVDPAAIPLAVGVWLMACLLAIVTASPYRGDDLTNKNIRELVRSSGKSLPEFTADLVAGWMSNEGRFFPGSLSWTYSLFWLFETRIAYKIAIGLVLVWAIAMFGVLVARLTGGWTVTALFGPLIFGLVQIRATTEDGIVSYAGLIPLTAGLTVTAIVILIMRSGFGWGALAALCYSLALITYETVFLFAPIMIGIVIYVRRTWQPALAIAIPALIQFSIVVFLRLSMLAPPSAGYSINLEHRAVFVTFTKQALAALPLSQWIFSDEAAPAISVGSIVIGGLVAGVPLFISLVISGRHRIRATLSQILVIGVFGLWMWVSSSSTVAVTQYWQMTLHRGQGYISVIYGYFGLALCALSLYMMIDGLVADRSPQVVRFWRYGSALFIAAVGSLTFAGNMTVALL